MVPRFEVGPGLGEQVRLAFGGKRRRGRGEAPGAWAEALTRLVKDGRLRSLEIAKVDGAAVAEDPLVADALRAAGFADGYRGLVLRA